MIFTRLKILTPEHELCPGGIQGEFDFVVRFSVLLITSFAERPTDEDTVGAKLVRQADLLTDMLVTHFRIG